MLRHQIPARQPGEPSQRSPITSTADRTAAALELQQTVGNRATTAVIQRLSNSDDADAAPARPDRSPDGQLPLRGAVGVDQENDPTDVMNVRSRLDELGFDTGAWMGSDPSQFDASLGAAIQSFQRREVRGSDDGVVTPGEATHSALAIGRSEGSGELDERLDQVVADATHPAVERLRTRITEAEALQASCETKWSQEQGERRDALVEMIGEIRAEIAALADEGLSDDELASVSAWAHRRLNRASPYYLQTTNADFLEEGGSDTRTCNLTCLAMALEALGVNSSAYTGDRSVLEEIRGHPGDRAGDYDYAKAFDRAKDDTSGGTDLAGLRLPDFIQLVFVGRLMEGGTAMMPAVRQSYDDILDPIELTKVARLFGVAAYARPIGFPSRDRDLRQRHVEAFGGLLDQGKQVIGGVGGHFAKIENIADDGLVINDPATGRRSDETIPWEETAHYIKSLMVLG